MKKAGIIIGGIFILGAILLFALTQSIESKKNEDKDKNVVEQVDTELKEEVKVIVKEPEKEPEKETEKEPTETEIRTSVIELSDSVLKMEGLEKEDIVVISSKGLLLIDEAVGQKHGKSIAYVLNTLTDKNKPLKLYVTETVYNSYNTGDRLKVNYKVIKNDVGTEFTLIKKVMVID